jgi:hypothetical protein
VVRTPPLPLISCAPSRSTGARTPTMSDAAPSDVRCCGHPNHLPNPLDEFALLPATCRSVPHSKPRPRAHFQASSGESPSAPPHAASLRRVAAASSLVVDASRPILNRRRRLDRGIPVCPGLPWTDGPGPPRRSTARVGLASSLRQRRATRRICSRRRGLAPA